MGARLTGLVLAFALGYFLYGRASYAWADYWLLRDARQGTATVIGEHWSGHAAVDYWYEVGHVHYRGHSSRNWKDEKKVQAGDQTKVFFSESHPGISCLYMPDTILEGWPVILVALVIELFAFITIINPRSSWALSLMKTKKENT